MLAGESMTLRQVREADLDLLCDAHTNIRNRGRYFPLGVMSQTAFRREFAEHGFWQATEGMLGIETPEGEIAGHIEFFRPGFLLGCNELSYQLYADQYAGRGFVAEAVRLLVDYLFAAKKEHRVQLVIVGENVASRCIAEKCGFVLEGTSGARSSTTVATRTCCSTPCCGPTPGPDDRPHQHPSPPRSPLRRRARSRRARGRPRSHRSRRVSRPGRLR